MFQTARSWTALAVCIVGLPAIVEGAHVAHFSIVEMGLNSAQSRVAALAGWRDTTGVAAAAREPDLFMLRGNDPDQLNRQRQQLADYLTVKPMSPTKWLELAQLGFTMGEPVAHTVAVYSMSQLTGPYEGNVMPDRGLFGVLLWESLPADARLRTARDVALADFAPDQLQRIRNLLKVKLQSSRDALRLAVLNVEGLPAARLAELGFE